MQHGDTVRNVLDRAGVDYQSSALVIKVNNKEATLDTRLNEGDVLQLTPPNIEGGAPLRRLLRFVRGVLVA